MLEATVTIPEPCRPVFSKKAVVCDHNLPKLEEFKDKSIIKILSDHPRSHLRVWSAGINHNAFTDWQPVDTAGLNGEEIFHCLIKGKFWINVQRIDLFNNDFKNLAESLYRQLADQCPHFQIEYINTYLLLSSPQAFVYLHLDSYENFFWCVRGGKIFHLYPPDDHRIVSQDLMEDICFGAEDFFQYKDEFRNLYSEYRLTPGQMLSWPQHSPHQVFNNEEFNVGLGTFHGTRDGIKRVTNYVASRYFRENWPLLRGHVRHNSFGTSLRRNLYRVARRLGYTTEKEKGKVWARYRLNPQVPGCVSELKNGSVLAECSRQ